MEYLEFAIAHGIPGGAAPWFTLSVVGALGVGAAVLLAGALTPQVSRRLLPAPHEPKLEDFIPIDHVEEDGVTLRCKHKWAVRSWRLRGLDHVGLEEETANRLYDARCATFDALAGEAVEMEVRWFTVRERDRSGDGTDEGDAQTGQVINEVARRWARMTREGVYRNRHYLTIACRRSGAGRKALEQASAIIEATLANYEPKLLRAPTGDEPLNGDEHPASPFAFYIAPATANPLAARAGEPLGPLLAQDDVSYMGRGVFRFCGAGRTRYGSCIGIRALPDAFSESMAMELQRAPTELCIVHSMRPVERSKAILGLTIKARSIRALSIGSGDVAAAQVRQAQEMVQGVHESGLTANLWEYTPHVVVYSPTQEGLREARLPVERAITLSGGSPITEGFAAEAVWWGALPEFPVLSRPWKVLTFPIAALTVPQTTEQGHDKSDWWDKPLIRMRAAEGSIYRFNFHATDARQAVGHTIVVAPTGGGKTTLMCHLAAHVLRIPNANVVLLDRDRGAEVFVAAAGGRYVRFGAMEEAVGDSVDDGVMNAKLNPLQLPDTPANREFLESWIASLMQTPPTGRERQAIRRGIDIAYDMLPPHLRSLRDIHRAAFAVDSNARREIGQWCGADHNGDVFNAPEDTSDMEGRLIGFDCTHIFDRKELASPVVSYLIHKIWSRSRASAQPTMIYIDETAPMLEHDEFKRAFQRGLQEGRKLRQVFVSCFQNPRAIEDLGVAALMRGQCKTAILMPSENATAEDYAGFQLTRAEMRFIRRETHRTLQHAALIKRYEGGGSVIVDVSLKALGPYMRVYASGREDVLRLRRLQRRHGEDEGLRRYIESDEGG